MTVSFLTSRLSNIPVRQTFVQEDKIVVNRPVLHHDGHHVPVVGELVALYLGDLHHHLQLFLLQVGGEGDGGRLSEAGSGGESDPA